MQVKYKLEITLNIAEMHQYALMRDFDKLIYDILKAEGAPVFLSVTGKIGCQEGKISYGHSINSTIVNCEWIKPNDAKYNTDHTDAILWDTIKERKALKKGSIKGQLSCTEKPTTKRKALGEKP